MAGQAPPVPAYFDLLIAGFARGATGRSVHLGYWDPLPAAGAVLAGNEFGRAQQRLDDLLIALAAPRSGETVLDVGCGFGGTLDAINRQGQDMRLTGVNIDPRQIAICAQLAAVNGNQLRWEVADAIKLPFADASFDCVLCIEAMFHFSSRRQFFCEAARVLKPGGRLVSSDITFAAAARALDTPAFPIEAPLQEAYGPWPDFWGKDADHPRLAEAAGLACTKVLDITTSTLPSHAFTTPRNADVLAPAGDPALRAALMLRWLHQQGHLRYLCYRFDKPGAN